MPDMDEHSLRLFTHMEPGDGKGIFSCKTADRAEHEWGKEGEPLEVLIGHSEVL